MTISKTAFNALRAGQRIVGGQGIVWHVGNNVLNSGDDVPGEREVWLRRDGDERARPYGWLDGHQIVDDQMGTDLDLNHPSARVAT